jgi:ribosomal protein S18 acetylase RimI-like enzyme
VSIAIRSADDSYFDAITACDFSFEIKGAFVPEFSKTLQEWAVMPTETYWKDYGIDIEDLRDHIFSDDSALFAGEIDGKPAGHIALVRNWNGYARIEDIAVDAKSRLKGLGKTLMDAAADWAREKGLAGLMLETQNNNMAACRFYQRYGFSLGGIDRYLYRGLAPETDEIALFWYLHFGR